MQWSDERESGDKTAGQFSTPEWVADLVCSRLKSRPNLAADLGIGKGALSLALARRFPNAPIVGIDHYSVPRESRKLMRTAGITLAHRDIGVSTFPAWFTKRYGRVHTVISNPPFTYIDDAPAARQLLSNHGMIVGEKKQRLDLIFLAQAMAMLHGSGEAAFVLPVSAFSMTRSLRNLKTMVERFGLCELIRLPQTLYSDADVQTAVLIMRPNQARAGRDRFRVYAADRDGAMESTGVFSARALIDYYGEAEPASSSAANSIAGLGGTVTRGRLSSRELAKHGVSHFHTTSFKAHKTARLVFDEEPSHAFGVDVPASAGDILLPRVGTRCLGRSAIVVQGSRHISDCVFRISTPEAKRRQLWEFLSSDAGSTWQLSLARGTCAKFISQQDLLSAPLPVPIR